MLRINIPCAVATLADGIGPCSYAPRNTRHAVAAFDVGNIQIYYPRSELQPISVRNEVQGYTHAPCTIDS